MNFINSIKFLTPLVCALLAACSFVPYERNQSEDPVLEKSADFKESSERGLEKSTHEDIAVAESEASSNLATRPTFGSDKGIPRGASKKFANVVATMEEQDWLTAEQLLIEFTEQYPGLSGGFTNLGIVYHQLDRLEAAEKAYLDAVAINPNNMDAHNQLGIVLRQLGKFTDAEAAYKQAINLWPQYADAYLNLAILYDLYMGRWQEATVNYNRYQEIQSEPDRQVAGWILELNRRIDRLAVN